MRTITCHCDHTFEADLPEAADLDRSPELLSAIADGSFLTCRCPSCGARLHTDLDTLVSWPSRNMNLALVSEVSRLAVLSGHAAAPEGFDVVVGYAELADRVAVFAADLNPLTVETLKFHLASKALESLPSGRPVITFEGLDAQGNLLFHIHGLRDGEVAVTAIPRPLYESVKAEVETKPEDEPQSCLRNGPYLSVQNLELEGGDHA